MGNSNKKLNPEHPELYTNKKSQQNFKRKAELIETDDETKNDTKIARMDSVKKTVPPIKIDRVIRQGVSQYAIRKGKTAARVNQIQSLITKFLKSQQKSPLFPAKHSNSFLTVYARKSAAQSSDAPKQYLSLIHI